MHNTNLASFFPKPLARLAVAGLACMAGAGILGSTVAATLNTRARPGELARLAMSFLENVLPGEQLDVTGYRLDDTWLPVTAVITALLLLPLVLLYFRFSLRPAWEAGTVLAAKIAAGGGLAFIASLFVAAAAYEDAGEWLLGVLPCTLAATVCAASAAMYLLLLRRRQTVLAVTPLWPFLLAAALAVLSALVFLGAAIASLDSDRENIFFNLPLMLGLYAVVSLSALAYREQPV